MEIDRLPCGVQFQQNLFLKRWNHFEINHLLRQKANLIKTVVRTRACLIIWRQWSSVLFVRTVNSEKCTQCGMCDLSTIRFTLVKLVAFYSNCWHLRDSSWRRSGGYHSTISLSSSHPTPLTPDVTASNTHKPGSNPPLALRTPAWQLLVLHDALHDHREGTESSASLTTYVWCKWGKKPGFFFLSPFPEHRFTSSWFEII